MNNAGGGAEYPAPEQQITRFSVRHGAARGRQRNACRCQCVDGVDKKRDVIGRIECLSRALVLDSVLIEKTQWGCPGRTALDADTPSASFSRARAPDCGMSQSHGSCRSTMSQE